LGPSRSTFPLVDRLPVCRFVGFARLSRLGGMDNLRIIEYD